MPTAALARLCLATSLLVVGGTVCANILFPSNTVDVHFEVLATGIPKLERIRLLEAAEKFKRNTVAAKPCASLSASADGRDGTNPAQMHLSFQRMHTVAELLKPLGISPSVSDVVYTATEQQWPPPRWTLPIRVSDAQVEVTFRPCRA